MIGNTGSSAYKSADDFKNHRDYLSYMYAKTKGVIARSIIASGRYYEKFSYGDRLINKNKYYGIENVYVSMNSFRSARKPNKPMSGRKVENLRQLNALYLDLDCYKIGLTQEQVLMNLEENYFGKTIPVPTFVINSGRGVYLIWKICEHKNALPRWNNVQKYLLEQCSEFNADPQAIDAARILRVPFTKNSKNGNTVKIMQFNDISYTLHEIITEYNIQSTTYESKKDIVYPYGQATQRQREVAQWQASEFGLELPDFNNYQETFDFIKENSCNRSENTENLVFSKLKSLKNMLLGRVNDLFKLFSLRKGVDCCREYALFLCRSWVAEKTKDFDYALQVTKKLNKSFDVPFDEKYVETRTKSAETKLKSGSLYKYTTKKIIEVLRITPEEQAHLKHICIDQEALKARKKEANKRAYLARLKKDGKQEKSKTIEERRQKIFELLNSGKSKAEICEILNISARTFDRDKAAIVKNTDLLNRKKNEQQEEKQERKMEITELVMKKTGSPFFQSNYYRRKDKVFSKRELSLLKTYNQISLYPIPVITKKRQVFVSGFDP